MSTPAAERNFPVLDQDDAERPNSTQRKLAGAYACTNYLLNSYCLMKPHSGAATSAPVLIDGRERQRQLEPHGPPMTLASN